MSKLTQKQKAIIFDAERTVQKFNRLFPIGSKVMQRNVGIKTFPFKERTVKSKAFISESFEPVVFFQGCSGYFSVLPEFIDYPEADA